MVGECNRMIFSHKFKVINYPIWVNIARKYNRSQGKPHSKGKIKILPACSIFLFFVCFYVTIFQNLYYFIALFWLKKDLFLKKYRNLAKRFGLLFLDPTEPKLRYSVNSVRSSTDTTTYYDYTNHSDYTKLFLTILPNFPGGSCPLALTCSCTLYISCTAKVLCI